MGQGIRLRASSKGLVQGISFWVRLSARARRVPSKKGRRGGSRPNARIIYACGMNTLDAFYNLMMLIVDALALRTAERQRPGQATVTLALAIGAILAMALVAGAMHGNAWRMMRLSAWAVFLHGAVLLAGAAGLWARSYPRWAASAASAALLVAGTGIHAFVIEPQWLEITRWRLTSDKLYRPVRIAVLADLQTDSLGPYEHEVLRRLLAEQPDLILLAGDYFQAEPHQYTRLYAQLNQWLRQLRFSAPLGVYAVRGNMEEDDWTEAFAGMPVRTVERTESFDLGPIRLTCLSMADSFAGQTIALPREENRFHIMLGHSPDFALAEQGADLLIAGHTHGGQVRLPLIGPLATNTRLPRRLATGLNSLPGGGWLMVSRGVGLERGEAPRLRFLCRPELVILDLVPENP